MRWLNNGQLLIFISTPNYKWSIIKDLVASCQSFLTFIIFNIHSYNTIIRYILTSFIIFWGLYSCIFIASPISKRSLYGVPIRESNSGLPYSKPTHYHWATPYPNGATPKSYWATPHPYWATLHPNWATLHLMRRTLIEPHHTLTEPRRILIKPGSTLTEPRHTLIEPRRTLIDPRRTLIEPSCTLIEPRRT